MCRLKLPKGAGFPYPLLNDVLKERMSELYHFSHVVDEHGSGDDVSGSSASTGSEEGVLGTDIADQSPKNTDDNTSSASDQAKMFTNMNNQNGRSLSQIPAKRKPHTGLDANVIIHGRRKRRRNKLFLPGEPISSGEESDDDQNLQGSHRQDATKEEEEQEEEGSVKEDEEWSEDLQASAQILSELFTPFQGKNPLDEASFDQLSILHRAKLVKLLCEWRFTSAEFNEQLRTLDEEAARLIPIAVDSCNNRFFHFDHFGHEHTRIYMQTAHWAAKKKSEAAAKKKSEAAAKAEPESDDNGVACEVCGKTGDGDNLLLCDGGGEEHGCHTYCMSPPIHDIPESEWFCPPCRRKRGEEAQVVCFICKLDEDDDNILLCDSYGYPHGCHMYCLTPPLRKVPRGNWHCPQCTTRKKELKRANESQTSLKEDITGKKSNAEDPKDFFLAGHDLESLQTLVKTLSSGKAKDKQAGSVIREILDELIEIKKRELSKEREEQARLERLALIPVKRSARLQVIEEEKAKEAVWYR